MTHLLRDSPDVGESLPEDNEDSLGTATEGRGRTVEGSVSST